MARVYYPLGAMHDDPYADPALYDLEYADHTEDITHYVRLARRSRGPVLELGCGTGRLTLPIARAGVAIDGIDLSQQMLDGLEAKLAAEPAKVAGRIRSMLGDFRAPPDDLRPAYRLVIWPFNAIHHCRGPEDVHQTLRAAVDRLAPGGRIAIDLYLPDRQLYDRDPEATYEHRIFRDPRTGQPLHTWERGWWDEANRMHHVVYTYRARDGSEQNSHLQLRMFERDEVEEMLARAGLRIEASASDFSGTPLQDGSLKWVLSCRPVESGD